MDLKVDVFRITLKYILLANKSIKYQSNDRRHEVDCVEQSFQHNFAHVDHLEALEMIQ